MKSRATTRLAAFVKIVACRSGIRSGCRSMNSSTGQQETRGLGQILVLALLFAWPLTSLAQYPTPEQAQASPPETAAVMIDGRRLFDVKGVSVYPAKQRAKRVQKAIIEAARSDTINPEDLSVSLLADRAQIRAGDIVLINVLDSDAWMQGLGRETLAEVYSEKIAEAISRYRIDRRPERLLKATGLALAYLLAFFLLTWLVNRLFRSQKLLTTRLPVAELPGVVSCRFWHFIWL